MSQVSRIGGKHSLKKSPMNEALVSWTLLNKLYKQYHRKLVAFCSHFLGDHDLAQDIAHDVMIKALKSLPVDVRDPWHWLCRVARNACIDELRKSRRVLNIEAVEEVESHADPESDMISQAERMGVRDALATLSRKHQETVRLAYWENMTYEEIGRAMGVPASSVRDRLHYSRETLKKKLRHLSGELMLWGPIFWLRRRFSDLQHAGFESAVAALLVMPLMVGALRVVPHPPNASQSDRNVEATRATAYSRDQANSTLQMTNHGAATDKALPTHTLSDPLTLGTDPEQETPGSAHLTLGPIYIDCSDGDGLIFRMVCSILENG